MNDCLVCPHCWTVIPATAVMDAGACCPHCSIDLTWLSSADDVRTLLTNTADATSNVRSFWLCAEVEWPGGQTTIERELPARFTVPVPGAGALNVTMERPNDLLQIGAENREPKSLTTPGWHSLGAARLYCRVMARVKEPPVCPTIAAKYARTIPIPKGSSIGFTRNLNPPANWISLGDPVVAWEHCLAVRSDDAQRSYWIVDCRSKGGTFVNRKAVIAKRLDAGDLVQIGPFAWLFNQEDGHFVPAPGIAGARLQLHGVGVKKRLTELNLTIEKGSFIGVVGPSGAGKSTLIQVILGAWGKGFTGTVLADGFSIDEHRSWFQELLAYVSQRPVVHPQLSAKQAVEYAAELRCGGFLAEEVAAVLRSVELSEAKWEQPPWRLSGGEATRVRTAAELITQPRILLLDEPTSGVDRSREIAIFRMLRSLSWRGCTVIVITHALERLADFDRVLVIRDGVVAWDGAPEELRCFAPTGDLRNLDLQSIGFKPYETSVRLEEPAAEPDAVTPPVAAPVPGLLQWKTLLRREIDLATREWMKSLVLPLIVVPFVFALAVHLAVPTAKVPMLGFLTILSIVWMAASLSLMAIVNERDVFEHERLLYLRIPRYVTAKLVYLGILAFVQTVMFVGVLWGVRRLTYQPDAMLQGLWPRGILILLLTSWAAVGMGLAISAIVRTSKPAASFLLPLVMIAQIVFSVQVAGRGDAALYQSYGEFHSRGCNGGRGCPQRAQYWTVRDRWQCERCFQFASDQRAERGPEAEGRNQKAIDWAAWSPPDEATIEHHNAQRPPYWAARLSYLTISRPADIALRCFSYSKVDFERFSSMGSVDTTARNTPARFGYNHWFRGACMTLLTMIIGFPAFAAVLLWLQSPRRSFKRCIQHAFRHSHVAFSRLVQRLSGRIWRSHV